MTKLNSFQGKPIAAAVDGKDSVHTGIGGAAADVCVGIGIHFRAGDIFSEERRAYRKQFRDKFVTPQEFEYVVGRVIASYTSGSLRQTLNAKRQAANINPLPHPAPCFSLTIITEESDPLSVPGGLLSETARRLQRLAGVSRVTMITPNGVHAFDWMVYVPEIMIGMYRLLICGSTRDKRALNKQ